jgi:hypothetical protein
LTGLLATLLLLTGLVLPALLLLTGFVLAALLRVLRVVLFVRHRDVLRFEGFGVDPYPTKQRSGAAEVPPRGHAAHKQRIEIKRKNAAIRTQMRAAQTGL